MQYRKFGNTDLKVSEIGFGAWAIGGGAMIGTISIGWGDSDDSISIKAIHASLDAGINFFDTADIYGLGHSEKLIGQTIGNKKEIIIATKVGNVSRNDQFTVDYSKEYIIQACEESLKRLKRDSIDYYQLHTARMQHLQNGECIEAMLDLQRKGMIRYWGISLNTFEPLPEVEFFMKNKIGNGFQFALNIINQNALSILKKSNKAGYAVIARMPLQFGLLTGKYDSGFDFPENDHRKKRLTKEVIDSCANVLEPVWKLCEKYSCTKTELAMSYILSYTEVSTIIPGIRTSQQVSENTSGLFTLESGDRNAIEQLGKKEFVPILELLKKQG